MIKVFIKHPGKLGYTAVIKNELKEMQEINLRRAMQD